MAANSSGCVPMALTFSPPCGRTDILYGHCTILRGLNKPGRVWDARTTDCTRTFICCISRCSATPGLRKARVRGTID